MSTLVASKIQNLSGSVLLPTSGSIIQTVYVRTDTRAQYTSGTRVTPLDVNITPNATSNLILVEWNINGHVDNNTAINILVNGNPYPSAFPPFGFSLNALTGYNNTLYGYTTPNYDGSANSTLQNTVVIFPLRAEGTNRLNIGIQFFGLNFFLNRTENGGNVDDYESSVSSVTAYEIVGD